MADAIVSFVVERFTDIMVEQARNEVNSVIRGVEEEVLNLSYELKNILNVLDDAKRRKIKDENGTNWLKELKDTAYQMEDVLDQWNWAILNFKLEQKSNDAVVAPKQKVCFLIPSSCLRSKKDDVRHDDIARKIEIVKEKLDLILAKKDRYNFVISQLMTHLSSKSWRVQSTSLIDLEKVHGRDKDRDNIVKKLKLNGDTHILAIVGVGGLGKTTFAQLVYNDSQVKKSFELRIWVCVSDPFDEVEIAKRIVESVRGGSSPNTNNLEMLLLNLRDSISGKKFLLVLDDVWTTECKKWERLRNFLECGGAGSKILVTTRNENAAIIMGTMENDIHRLGQLTNEDCWLLLCRIALFGRSEEECGKFKDIGKKITNKCNGLPLAAMTLGGLLRTKSSLEEWENVLNTEMWEMKAVEVGIFPHLRLSYNELSPALKRCFSYCAVFPKDFEIEVENLIENWMVLGYLGSNIGSDDNMEIKGQEYFQNLAMCSLFQEFKKSGLDGQIFRCKMCYLVHDFAQSLRKNGRAEASSCQVCKPSLVSNVKEYHSLFWDKEPPPNQLCDCLKGLRVLGITNCKLHSLPQGIENLINLRWLNFSYIEFFRGDLKTICKLYNLQFLRLKHCELQEIPMEIRNLIHLRHLDLSFNKSLKELPQSICGLHELQSLKLKRCGLQEIPMEIGNLIHLRHLDLSFNKPIKELPESICGLHELLTLNVVACSNLCRLPEGIQSLENLKHLHNRDTSSLKQFPQGLAQITGLRTLNVFRGGSGWSKLGWLKNLNFLHGSLTLWIRLTNDWKDAVLDAPEAELKRKKHIQNLEIIFFDYVDERESSMRMDVIDALEPHPKLRNLEIWNYMGSKLPGWIASPLKQIRYIKLHAFNHMWSLPPLGKLPFLEEIYMSGMYGLRLVGREFLGIETTATAARDIDIKSSSSSSSSSSTNNANIGGFPKLKKLTFRDCPKWTEWEDITAEEEESTAVSLMPCLTELTIQFCKGLTGLPRRLLRKAPLLDALELQQSHGDKDGSKWKIHIAKSTPSA